MRSATLTPHHVDVDALRALVAPPAFAGRDDVESTAARLVPRIGTHTGAGEGVRYFLALSAGTVALRTQTVWDATEGWSGPTRRHGVAITRGPWEGRRYAGEAAGRDVTRIARLDGRRRDDERDAAIDAAAAVLGVAQVYTSTARPPARRVREWSRASRRRMTRTLAELDYSEWSGQGGVLAMVTLTLPGSWQVVAANGRQFKALIRAFLERWRRAIGSVRGLWKLEFQKRGAPHLHMLVRVPAMVGTLVFEQWLSETWADICAESLSDDELTEWIASGEYSKHLSAGTGVDFSGVKFSDPRRTSVYFLKHSAKTMDDKEYQHIVPEEWRAEGAGPGRFWGYWGLRRARAELEVDHHGFIRARRILRKVAAARAALVDLQRRRAAGESAWSMRRPKVRSFGAAGGGWVLVNDGIALAWDVGRALALP